MRVRLGLAYEQRLLGTYAPQARVVEHHGLVGAVVGSVPESSIANATVVLEPGALDAPTIEQVHAAYTDAGVQKWGFWVDPEDADTLAAISSAGFVFDSHPTPMAAYLADVDLDGAPAARTATPEEVGRVNDLAYGHADGRIERMIGSLPTDVLHNYAALGDDGELVATVTVVDADDDAAVWLVATVPWARNQGHARRLLRRALIEARERGCTTTTLIASALGAPVYTRIGYRAVGAIHLWERRP